MKRRFLQIVFFVSLFAFGSICAAAQFDVSTPSGNPRKEELPPSIKENLAKGRIEQEKKEYEELLTRADEALKLSGDLEKSFAANNKLSSADLKKLEKLEKVVKKIRKDLGGDDDDDAADEKAPSTVESAFKSLRDNTTKLFDELKKSTRYTISALAIQSSNALLKVVRFLRFAK